MALEGFQRFLRAKKIFKKTSFGKKNDLKQFGGVKTNYEWKSWRSEDRMCAEGV